MTSRGMTLLSEDECNVLLRSRTFGRVATEIGGHIMVFPVYYGMVGNDVVFRTDPGTKLGAALLNTRVLFEIDDEAEGWSVVVRGHAEELRREPAQTEAVKAIGERWPMGEREHVVRVANEQVTGRRVIRTAIG